MINDKIKPSGELTIVLRDQNGNIKEQRVIPNLVTTVGKNLIAQRLGGGTYSSPTGPTHMALGTSSTAANIADTILGNEFASTRVAMSSTTGSVTVSSNVITYTCTFAAGVGTTAITEAGIFTNGTINSGTLLCHTVFAAVNKDTLDTLTINWAVTIS